MSIVILGVAISLRLLLKPLRGGADSVLE